MSSSSGIFLSCLRVVSSFLLSFSLLSTSKITLPRHDALGFEYIDQSKNFVPQVCRTITFPMMWGLYLMVRKGAQGLRHSEARWEGLSYTDDKQVTLINLSFFWFVNLQRQHISSERARSWPRPSAEILSGEVYYNPLSKLFFHLSYDRVPKLFILFNKLCSKTGNFQLHRELTRSFDKPSSKDSVS